MVAYSEIRGFREESDKDYYPQIGEYFYKPYTEMWYLKEYRYEHYVPRDKLPSRMKMEALLLGIQL